MAENGKRPFTSRISERPKGFLRASGEKIDDAKRENAKSKYQDISMCFAPVSAMNSVRLC